MKPFDISSAKQSASSGRKGKKASPINETQKQRIAFDVGQKKLLFRKEIEEFTRQQERRRNLAIEKLQKECLRTGGHSFEFERRAYGYGALDGDWYCIWCGARK